MSSAQQSETRVRIGRGNHVHRANLDGNTYCGSQRRMGRRSGVAFLPADTAVTCTKCGADASAPVEAPVPAPAAPATCPEGHRIARSANGECVICL